METLYNSFVQTIIIQYNYGFSPHLHKQRGYFTPDKHSQTSRPPFLCGVQNGALSDRYNLHSSNVEGARARHELVFSDVKVSTLKPTNHLQSAVYVYNAASLTFSAISSKRVLLIAESNSSVQRHVVQALTTFLSSRGIDCRYLELKDAGTLQIINHMIYIVFLGLDRAFLYEISANSYSML
jgi:hypothetical protein